MATTTTHARPNKSFSEVEQALRVDLAAFYRIVALLGWDEFIYTHISLRLPGPEKHFLINPFGMMYDEVRASDLTKIDIDGNIIGKSSWPVNQAGFTIHSAIHDAREDAHCVIHLHTTAGMGVAQQKEGLLPTSFYAAVVYDQLSYHDFEGSVVTDGEKSRLVEHLGQNNFLILRNHGLLACGRTVAETFGAALVLQRACEIQLAAQSGGAELIEVPYEVRNAHKAALNQTIKDAPPANDMSELDRLAFDAMVRKIDRIDPSFRD
ncbi:MAG: class II aldolase/adducin family protein [Novosphingobium sp.]